MVILLGRVQEAASAQRVLGLERSVCFLHPRLPQVPRLRSPLVHLVGFMAERFNASQQPMPPDEAAWWEWLDRAQERTPAGVIYVAFGSEVRIRD